MKVTIVTGEINSGKTNWCVKNLLNCNLDSVRGIIKNSCWKNNSINGILQIKLNMGQFRVGYDVLNISNGRYVPMVRHRALLPSDWDEAFVFGEFSFSTGGLREGIEWIREGFNDELPMVVDEIGPVEINRLGFYDVLTELFRGESRVPEIYVIVRKKLLKKVIDAFSIEKFTLIDVDTMNI